MGLEEGHRYISILTTSSDNLTVLHVWRPTPGQKHRPISKHQVSPAQIHNTAYEVPLNQLSRLCTSGLISILGRFLKMLNEASWDSECLKPCK